MQRTPARTNSFSSPRARRRAGGLLAGALVAAVSLSGCSKLTGFDVETDKPYVPGNGANYRVANIDAPIDVVGMVIVSETAGAGTLIATFANNDPEAADAPQIVSEAVTISGYTPFELEPNGTVNLAADAWVEANDPVLVEGDDVVAGASIPMTVGEGDLAELVWVPVVPNAETTSTLPRADDHGEGHGEDHGDEEGAEEAEHVEGDDDSPNPWAGLDRSTEPQPARPTMDPTAGETEG